MKYRKEVDGLRALAVLPVILFHGGFQTFSGGFVGVDIFFVISGYLITSIIFAEKQEGTFTLVNFYERRARRILPALFVVMLACLPFAWLWMLPSDLKDFSRSLLGVTTFVSNILFWRESGYFVTAAELKPLLHTWSLAVEEQYYLLFPIFLLMTWRLGKRWIVGILAVLSVISLAGAQWGAINKPIANFYLLPTRGWELMVGAFIALSPFAQKIIGADTGKTTTHLNQLGSLIGLLLIVYSVFVFDKTTPFPSLYTLIPTLGAAFIILFANPQTFAGKLLSSRIFVSIGLISYSAYLWHQPLFAFARHRSADEPGKPLLFLLTLVAIGLAYISLNYLERPFRDKKKVGRWPVFFFALAGSIIFLAIGFIGYSNEGLPNRFPPELSHYLYPEKTQEGTACKLSLLEGTKKIKLCYFGDTNATYSIALYGDSHSQALFSALDDTFRKSKIKGVRVYLDDCGVIPEVLVDSKYQRTGEPLRECLAAYDSLLTYFKENVSGVIVSIRWTMQVFPVSGYIDELAYDNGEGGAEYIEPRKYMTLDSAGVASYGEAGKRTAIDHLLQSMNGLDKKIFLVRPVPEVGWDIPKYNFNSYLNDKTFPKVISTSHDRFKVRNRFVNDILDGSRSYKNIVDIKPETLLCDSYVVGRCVAQIDGMPLYYDDDHLSNAGAALVIGEIMKHVK